ncbi:MAG: DNA recombination protein RmuC [Faecalibacterium sp.]|nr:DNA recombination protein RmuC [Faecalibacterium sp.]
MQYAILALLILANILLLAVLVRLLTAKPKDNTAELRALLDERLALQNAAFERRLSETQSELNSATLSAARTMGDGVQNAVRNMGAMLAENQANHTRLMEQRLRTLESTNEQKLEHIRSSMSAGMEAMRADNARKLEEIRRTVDEELQQTLQKRVSDSFEAVSRQLEQVYKGLGEMQTLAGDVGSLKQVLSGVKTRGILGEVQLGAILEEILAPEQYAVNVATVPGSTNRVEYAVRLPGVDGASVWLPIDSKFPGDTYAHLLDAYNSADPAAVEQAAKALEAVLRLEAKDIRTKYVAPPHTTNFAILFLPFEGLYAEVVNRGLLEKLQREYQVNIAGPSTMAALLNSLQMGFKTLAIQKRSGEVWQVLGAVKTEFEKFSEGLVKMQQRLRQTDEDLDKLIGTRTRAINRKLREVQTLDADSAAQILELPAESV